MFGAFLRWLINAWLYVTGKVVPYKGNEWLRGPMSDTEVIGGQFYERYAADRGLVIDKDHKDGLIGDFAALIPATDPLKDKLHPRVRHFYEHTTQYKLEVWSQWYSPISFFSRILIKSVSTRMDQLNIPLDPLETSRGMTNDVLQLKDPATGALVCACWLRRSILSGRVVYAGFYSGVIIDGSPLVKVAFPLPNGNVTVLLRVVVQPDGSVKLISRGRGIGDAGYYRVQKRDADSVRLRYLPLKESIHVYEDEHGTLRTDHLFSFWRFKFLHLHYKIMPV
ncbi:hypothetical protein [Nemorincola caseinilytica]